MKILVAGGAGHIGPHSLIERIADDRTLVAVDSFSNSSEDSRHWQLQNSDGFRTSHD